MIRTYDYKLYPNQAQIKTLDQWLRVCCWVHNQALEQRIKAYKRRKQSHTFYSQCATLTKWRARIERLRLVPMQFERDALRRVDRGMQAFFRRLKAGQTPGFPRFRSWRRYTSLECLVVSVYYSGDHVRVPWLGAIRCRGRDLPGGKQRGLRIIKRATGWYAQIILDDGCKAPDVKLTHIAVGVDLGLSSFATMSDGEFVDSPRWLASSSRKIRSLQRRVSRRIKWSNRRRKAVTALARQHERVAMRRRNFCHALSTSLVRRFDLIGVENLNVAGMSRSRLGKSILDAAWSTFISQLRYKAECAGTRLVEVDARFTSQECPDCGTIKPKTLSERVHSCEVCGLECDRDHAAARVILARALVATGAITPVEEVTAGGAQRVRRQVAPKKREGSKGHCQET